MRNMNLTIVSCTILAFAFQSPCYLMAEEHVDRIVVLIDDVDEGAPVVTVRRAPNGYDLYTGPLIANPEIEDGGLITLYGVDQLGTINPSGNGWRFVDPLLPIDAQRNATDIVWIDHDPVTGDLRVGFNTVEAEGVRYTNPLYHSDESADVARERWATVYKDDTIKVRFKSRLP